MGRLVKVASASELLPGQGRVGKAGDLEIALFNVGGSFHAIGNTCLHRGGPLGEGSLEGSVVTCPWHGWEYDLSTGASRVNPAMRVPVYRTEVKGEEVFIELS
ncbi:MAG TPA: Rieske (2Fe-2S) protein [Candidatus Acidoferrum sp.]|nr:Rieske (2Fe-2S) protein [Candidatus Acidoferrum sp.]